GERSSGGAGLSLTPEGCSLPPVACYDSTSTTLRKISRFQSYWWTGQPCTVQPFSRTTRGWLEELTWRWHCNSAGSSRRVTRQALLRRRETRSLSTTVTRHGSGRSRKRQATTS